MGGFFIPTPIENESEQDYVNRCIPILIKEGTAKDSEQASAICHSMYKNKHEQTTGLGYNDPIGPYEGDSKEGFLNRCIPYMRGHLNYPDSEYGITRAKSACLGIWHDQYKPWEDERPTTPSGGAGGRGDSDKKTQQLIRTKNGETQYLYTFCVDSNDIVNLDNHMIINLEKKENNKYQAIALIGDRFYKDKFVSYSEIAKAYKSMDGAYHDINHWGTTYMDGNPNIEYIIGYQKNTVVDPSTKTMKTDIFINESAPKYNIWKNFVDINKQANRTPNVSVSFWGSSKNIQAKDLPKGVNLSNYGYKPEDTVTCLYDLEFQALSTVFQGACNDKDGCGIGIGTVNQQNDKQILELMVEIEKEKNKKLGGKK